MILLRHFCIIFLVLCPHAPAPLYYPLLCIRDKRNGVKPVTYIKIITGQYPYIEYFDYLCQQISCIKM